MVLFSSPMLESILIGTIHFYYLWVSFVGWIITIYQSHHKWCISYCKCTLGGAVVSLVSKASVWLLMVGGPDEGLAIAADTSFGSFHLLTSRWGCVSSRLLVLAMNSSHSSHEWGDSHGLYVLWQVTKEVFQVHPSSRWNKKRRSIKNICTTLQ